MSKTHNKTHFILYKKVVTRSDRWTPSPFKSLSKQWASNPFPPNIKINLKPFFKKNHKIKIDPLSPRRDLLTYRRDPLTYSNKRKNLKYSSKSDIQWKANILARPTVTCAFLSRNCFSSKTNKSNFYKTKWPNCRFFFHSASAVPAKSIPPFGQPFRAEA